MLPADKATCKLSAVDRAQSLNSAKRQWLHRKPAALMLVAAAVIFGGGGMLAWLAFLLMGPLALLNFELGPVGRLLVDLCLCLLFFMQHSIMVRRRFRLWLTRGVHADLHGALYASASGVCLLLLTGLWQPVGAPLWTPGASVRWILTGIFLAAGIAAWWGARALGDFDALGIRPAMRVSPRAPVGATVPFTVRGPYRWVRHPLYLFSLIIIWSGPVFTVDRLMHNALWTIWIAIGAALEERDLLACFGDGYRSYRRRVPMLLPRSVKPLVSAFREPPRHDR